MDNNTKHFEFKDDKSSKFWEITQAGESVTVRYGKTGTTGQSQTKAAQKGVCEIRDAAREAAETEYASANETLAISRQEDLRANLTRSAKQA